MKLGKTNRGLIVGVLLILFAAVAWWAYNGGGAGALPSLGETPEIVNVNEQIINNTLEISFAINNSDAIKELVSAKLFYKTSNESTEYSSAQFTYDNASEIYKVEIDVSNVSVVYYYILVEYKDKLGFDRELRYPADGLREVEIPAVQENTEQPAPLLSLDNVTVSYNATVGEATLTVSAQNASEVTLYYAISASSNTTGLTYSNITLTSEPWTFTVTVDSNTTDTTYYYLHFFVVAKDNSTTVRLPQEGVFSFFANETKTEVFASGGQ